VLLLLVTTGSATEPVPAAPSVRFTDLGAAVAFPDRIVFTLEAESTAPVVRVELRYRPILGRVTFVARPSFTPGTRIALRYERDMRVNYLPPGIDIAYRWRFFFADGSWSDSPERTLAYVDDRYRWTQRTRGSIEVYSAVDDTRFIEAALAVTDEAVTTFSERFAVSLQGPLRILLYPSPEALRSALPVYSEEWIGGMAIPEYRLVLAGIVPGPGAQQELARILSHEVLHLAIAQATDNPFSAPPAWLDEGLATAYQAVEDPRLDAALERAREEGTLPSLRALRGGFGTDPERALLGYAASRSVVQFILLTYGEDGVQRLLATYREGVTDDEALHRSLGTTVDELDRAWKQWLSERANTRSSSSAIGLALLTLAAVVAALVRRTRRR